MKINKIILHCSAEPQGRNTDISTIRKWHTEDNGWKDVGYHYFIKEDGTIQKGRDESVVGAHTSGHNSNSIGICYGGGCNDKMIPIDTRTTEQKKSLYDIVLKIMGKYNLTFNDIYCHYQFANKTCPNFKIETFKEELLNYINAAPKESK